MGVSTRTSALLAAVIAGIGSGAPLAAQAPTSTADEADVRRAVDHYLQGHATGDGAHHRMVFHPASVLYWVNADTLATRTIEAYIAGSPGKPAEDEGKRKRWIEAVDVTGTAATAKVILDYPTMRFTDYFTLLKIKGEWKIMNKIFHREPKTP